MLSFLSDSIVFSIGLACYIFFFFFQAEDGIRDADVTGVQTCALPILATPHDLMKSDFGEYGEVNKAWNGDDVKGFTKIISNSLKIFNNVNKGQLEI